MLWAKFLKVSRGNLPGSTPRVGPRKVNGTSEGVRSERCFKTVLLVIYWGHFTMNINI
jgi:hypothetical protein